MNKQLEDKIKEIAEQAEGITEEQATQLAYWLDGALTALQMRKK